MYEVLAVAVIGAFFIGLLNLGVYFSRKHWHENDRRHHKTH